MPSDTAVHADAWLSGVFERPVYRVDTSAPPAALRDSVAQHLAAQAAASFYFAKVDTRHVATCQALGTLGFYAVDVNVTLGTEGGTPAPPRPHPGIHVSDCRPAEVDRVLDIASSAFEYSRFHLDPQVPDAVADRIKREWIANYARGARGEALMVARDGDRSVGFLAVLRSGPDDAPVRTIDLVAVDRAAQGRGAGRALVAAFIDRYAGSSALLQVGTQIANVRSLGLYQHMGFSIRSSAFVMHCHSSPVAAGRS